MNNWYSFRSKDRKVRGIVPARDLAAVARFAGYPLDKLVIARVRWDGKEFVSND